MHRTLRPLCVIVMLAVRAGRRIRATRMAPWLSLEARRQRDSHALHIVGIARGRRVPETRLQTIRGRKPSLCGTRRWGSYLLRRVNATTHTTPSAKSADVPGSGTANNGTSELYLSLPEVWPAKP